jgi:hypothetical protein
MSSLFPYLRYIFKIIHFHSVFITTYVDKCSFINNYVLTELRNISCVLECALN